MGMSTYIQGIRDLDGKFAGMMRVKQACETVGISYPEELQKYFYPNCPSENEELLRRDMEEMDITYAVTKSERDSTAIWEVDLSKINGDVKLLRFTNSY